MPNTQQAINRVCAYRGLPSVKKGQRCQVEGRPGFIIGGNTSMNFNVIFDNCVHIMNCHPGYKMKIFEDGLVIYNSERDY